MHSADNNTSERESSTGLRLVIHQDIMRMPSVAAWPTYQVDIPYISLSLCGEVIGQVTNSPNETWTQRTIKIRCEMAKKKITDQLTDDGLTTGISGACCQKGNQSTSRTEAIRWEPAMENKKPHFENRKLCWRPPQKQLGDSYQRRRSVSQINLSDRLL